MQRRDFLKKSVAGAVGLGWALQSTADESTTSRPNILWLSAEDICPMLGCYGDSYAHTPNLDRFATEGIRYTHAYAHAPVCSPARSGIITGVYPSTLGSHQHRSRITLPTDIRCFTEYLRKAGYYCSNNDKKDYNFREPPEAWDESSKNAHWRKRAPGQPFFSVFNFGICHESVLHKTEAELDEVRKKWGVERHDPAKARIPAYHPDIPEFRDDWARYYDSLTALDAQIAERLRELEEDGLSDNTIVMFWGDNGTGIARGKRWLYDSGTHVPLIVRFPKSLQHLAPGTPGFSEDRLVSFIDFASTILTLAGVSVPDYMQGRSFCGNGAGGAHEQLFFIRDRMDEACDSVRSVRNHRYRYIRNFYPHIPYDQYNEYLLKAKSALAWHRLDGTLEGPPALFMKQEKPIEELYDSEADPDEVNNLAGLPEHEATLLDMRQRLNKWILKTRDLGLLPEAEMLKRAGDKPPMELGADTKAYDLPRILDTANLPLQGSSSILELVTRLKDPDSAVRHWAATGLAILKPDDADSKRTLKGALDDDSPSVRVSAAHALCRIGQYDVALPALARELDTQDTLVRVRALNVLSFQGEKAAPALEAVKAISNDSDQYVSRAAQGALIRINE